jgi:S-adenosylmethionine decarboxylase
MTEHFGEHFMLDGYGGAYDKLNDQALVLRTLTELPTILNMNALSKPEVYFAKGNDERDPGGWSGFVVIEESHISIHTFPAKGFVSIDAYTCKNGLDVAKIEDYYIKMFELKEAETNLVVRGTRYPVQNIYEVV